MKLRNIWQQFSGWCVKLARNVLVSAASTASLPALLSVRPFVSCLLKWWDCGRDYLGFVTVQHLSNRAPVCPWRPKELHSFNTDEDIQSERSSNGVKTTGILPEWPRATSPEPKNCRYDATRTHPATPELTLMTKLRAWCNSKTTSGIKAEAISAKALLCVSTSRPHFLPSETPFT